MKKILPLCLFAFIATQATAETVGEKTGVNSALGISPTTADFVKEAAASDIFEIQSSQLATLKSVDPATLDFAQHMIKDHTKTTEELKRLIESEKVKVELPAQLDSSQQSELDKLKGLNGEDFAKQFKSDQQSGHKSAVSLFKRYASGGDNPDLKDWASKTLPHLEEHLTEAKKLDMLQPPARPTSNE